MSATVTQVKQALGTALGTITGMRAYAYQPDQINAPMAWSVLDDITYHDAMAGGLTSQRYRVSVVVGRASERSAQNALDTYLSFGSGGVRYAVEADPTLGGVVQTLIVESANNIQNLEYGDQTYLYVEFRVTVYT